MEKFGKSQSVTRTEDTRFLTGQGAYIDDVAPKDALFAYVLRSSVAHGDFTLDLSAARAAAGVALVLDAQAVAEMDAELGMAFSRVSNHDGTKGAAPERPWLAKERVRFVGEPLAVVVAESLAQSKDAAELIEVDYTDVPVHVVPEIGGPLIHPEAPDNLAFDYQNGDIEAVKNAFSGAAHVVKLQVPNNRVIANSMEPRGCYANWDGERLHLNYNGQGVWGAKRELARVFGLKAEQVRVTHPDVGGGFGMKAMLYPELFACAAAALQLGRPVRWMSERGEAMLSDNAGRDLLTECTLGFDADLRIVGYFADTISNLGAYNSSYAQFIQSELFAKVLMGTYDVQTAALRCRGVYTNTTPVDAYRGAGRPEAIFALEHAIDHAARVLGVDAWELRRKNFITRDQFPYKTATGETYDVGNFHKLLDRCETLCDRAGFASRARRSAQNGQLRGLGLCYYIEAILGDPTETTKVEFTAQGGAVIYVGTQSNGQGHETVFPQFLSDQTGIPVEKISMVQGDSDRIAKGGGTGGSRSVTTQNNATLETVRQIVEAFSTYLCERFEADEVVFDDEQFRIAGSNAAPTILDVADMARQEGREDLLTFSGTAKLPGRSYPNGAHVAEVEIDRETGVTRVVKYTVVDDFGNLINPMLAQGQVHGGVAQGIGQAVTEHTVFDPDGQLLSATFMDYAIPRAGDIPFVTFASEPVPSTANALGMKGCGEAGTVGALAAVTNAVADALWPLGIRAVDMPFTPNRVWQWLQDARAASDAAQ